MSGHTGAAKDGQLSPKSIAKPLVPWNQKNVFLFYNPSAPLLSGNEWRNFGIFQPQFFGSAIEFFEKIMDRAVSRIKAVRSSRASHSNG
ncbi:hypothetical protein [Roseibium sp.]|uniref:hypothetical protein n=1 Tax=Roseibium sp. TaxID=1936156 RepID=UPI003BAD933A